MLFFGILVVLTIVVACLGEDIKANHRHLATNKYRRDEGYPKYAYLQNDDDRVVYKINVINLADFLKEKELTSCFEAIQGATEDFFYKDWQRQIIFEYYDASALSSPEFWDGNGMPFFVLNEAIPAGSISFHSWHNTETTYATVGQDVKSALGFDPLPNFPEFTPFGGMSYYYLKKSLHAYEKVKNPYNIDDVHLLGCHAISAVIYNLLAGEQYWNYYYFDNGAPFTRDIRYAAVDGEGNVLNAKPDPVTGFDTLPKLNTAFPNGYLAAVATEAGYIASRISLSEKASFDYNGWKLANFVTREYFNCYYTRVKRYDFLGRINKPCGLNGGSHIIVYFTDLGTGITWVGVIISFGEMDGTIAGPLSGFNYPAGYTWFQFFSNTSNLNPATTTTAAAATTVPLVGRFRPTPQEYAKHKAQALRYYASLA